MGHSLEYDRDGQLFFVAFPVSNIRSESDSNRVTYTDQNGLRERGFSNHSELIKFVNWLCEHNT